MIRISGSNKPIDAHILTMTQTYLNSDAQTNTIRANIVTVVSQCFVRTQFIILSVNKDENAHRFALIAIRGELLERERER